MGVTVAEVTAVLTARDEMSAAVIAARQNVADFQQVIAENGPSVAFVNNLEKARAKLEELEAPIRKTQAAMEEMDASRITVTKGMADGFLNAKPAVDDIGDSVKKASSQMDDMDRIATRLVERMAILFALKGTEQFIQGLFESAAKVQDLATQFSITTDKVQEFKYASEQTGVPLGLITNAVDTLGKKLSSDSDSVASGLDTIGLNTQAFFAKEPGPRFDEVAEAIAEMGDKTARTAEEIALFGTDKIDPLIVKLKDLEKAAHDAGQVLGFEDVDALAKADKAFAQTENQLKVIAAQLLVAAQNWYAYNSARRGALLDEANSNANTPEQVAMGVAAGMANPLSPATPMTGGPKMRSGNKLVGGLDPNDTKGMAALDAILKSQTDEVKNREIEERQEAKILHEIAEIEAGRISSAEALLKLTSNQKAEMEASQKSMKELATASSAEEAARKSNLGRFGLGTDDEGHTVSQQMLNDPTFQRDQKMKALGREPSTPAGKSNREEQITSEWLDKVNSELTVIVGMTAAEKEAASAATKLAAAHDAQKTAVDQANMALMKMSGMSFPTVSSDYSAAGGPVSDGPWLKPMNQGALDFSKPGMSKGLNGPNQTQVTVQGNVYTMDAGGKEAFAQLVSEAVMNSGRQNRRLPSQ